MSRIILCGGKSVGKTTLAKDWCSINNKYQVVADVRNDVMEKHEITPDCISKSLSTRDKTRFFELQRLIFDEQNQRESELGDNYFICEQGPDPLVQTFLESEREANYISELETPKKCLNRYRSSLVVLLCPITPVDVRDGYTSQTGSDKAMPSTLSERQNHFTNGLHTVMIKFGIPYMYMEGS